MTENRQFGGQNTAPLEVPAILTGVENTRGIPQMRFIEDIGEFLSTNSAESTQVLVSLQTMHSKYKLTESVFNGNRSRLRAQIPELQASLDAVKMLTKKKEEVADMECDYKLADQVYAKATVPPTDKVYLWLGAKIMLEYPLDEAEQVLTENISAAEKKMEETREDLKYLREQIITTEVNMARVYNHDVEMRKEEKKEAAPASAASSS